MSNRQLVHIAQSLLDTAVHGVVGRVMDDLQILEDLFLSHPTILKDLSETSIPLETRCAALDKAIGDQLHPYVVHAAQMLVAKEALSEFAAFRDAVLEMAEKKGVYRQVEVISAVELEKQQVTAIKDKLDARIGGYISLKTRIQPSILGGLICRGKDWAIDASTKARIQRLQKNLASS